MEVRPGYKQTEVGLIPENWDVKRLEDLAELTSSKRIFESDYVLTGIPFYRGKEISRLVEGGTVDDPYFISEARYSSIKTKFGAPTRGDILITAVGTLGNVYVVDTDAPFYFKDGNLIWLRNTQGVSSRFLGIQLQRAKAAILDGAIGTSQKALTIVVLRKLPVAIAPLPEQRAIATALSDMDALLDGLNRLIAKKRDLKQASMQQLLTGQTRLPGFEGEWKLRLLGDLADLLKGNGLSKSQITPSGTRPCVLYGELFTTYSRVIECVVSRTDSSDGCISMCGDVIMPGSTTTSGIDLAIASALLKDGVALGGDINVIRQRGNDYDPVFLANYLTSVKRKEISDLTQGITIHHLYGRDLRTLALKLPSLPEQTAIATILSDMDSELAALEERLTKTRALKQAMMSELLTGKTRLPT